MAMARLTCSVQVVQLRIESRLWMEKLEAPLMSASEKLQRGTRWKVKVRKGAVLERGAAAIRARCCAATDVGFEPLAEVLISCCVCSQRQNVAIA